MSAVHLEVERLALRVEGLPEAVVREAMGGLDAEIARLLGEAPTRPSAAGALLSVVHTGALTVPAGTGADSLRRLVAERVLAAIAPAPGGAR